jgi:hypothetical protein
MLQLWEIIKNSFLSSEIKKNKRVFEFCHPYIRQDDCSFFSLRSYFPFVRLCSEKFYSSIMSRNHPSIAASLGNGPKGSKQLSSITQEEIFVHSVAERVLHFHACLTIIPVKCTFEKNSLFGV